MKAKQLMNNIPKKIYLQLPDDFEADFDSDFEKARKLGQITWSDDRENDSDIEYVLRISEHYFRPKTRGLLLKALKQNIKCEVVATNEEITSICLDGWLKFEGKYKSYPSINNGWVIFEAL